MCGLPDLVVVGGLTLTATAELSGADASVASLSLVGEYGRVDGAVRWFLSPLQNHTAKRLRVEDAVVESNAHEMDVFLRVAEDSFRRYVPIRAPSGRRLGERWSFASGGSSALSSSLLSSRPTTAEAGGRQNPSESGEADVRLCSPTGGGAALPVVRVPKRPPPHLAPNANVTASFRYARAPGTGCGGT